MGNNDEKKEMNNKPKRRCRCRGRPRRRRPRPRQYLLDRVNGTSKYDESERPPWRSCWVPPCVYYCSGCLEQNAVCEYVGARGCIKHDDDCGRRRSFFVAIASAKLAFLFSLLSCLAVSQNFDVLWMASFSQGTVYFVNQTTTATPEDHIWAMEPNQTYPVSEARVGLTAVAVREAYTEETITRSSDGTGQITGIRFIPELVVPFEEFCDILNDGLEYYMDPKQCDKCHQASSGLVLSCIASVVLELPSVLSDVLRMYPNYDVNCSKFFETVVVALSLLTSIYTAVEYGRACFANFYTGSVGYDHAGNVVRPDALEDKAFLHYSWKIGNGLIFLYVSVACKVVDMVCNMAVQTPSITRNRKEQEEYERLYGKNDDNDNDDDNRNNMDSSSKNRNEESPVRTGTTSFETAARQDTVDSSSVVEQAGRQQRDDDEEEGARYKNPPSGMTTKTEPGATIIVENNDVEQPRPPPPPPPPPPRRTRREEQQQEDEDEPPRQQQDANNNPRGRRGTPPETGDGTTVDHTTERANNAQQQMKGEEEQDDDDDDERVRKVATIPTIKGRTSTETMLVDDGDDSSSIERSSSSPRERNDDDESQRAANNNNNNPAASRSTTTETAGRLEGTSSVDSSVLEWAPPHSGREQPQRGGFPKGTASTNETTAAAGEDTITTNESSSELLPGQRLRSELRSSF